MKPIVTSHAPMLSVREGARAVEFYKAAFGAVETYRVESPDGAVVSRLAIDGAEFWVADESPDHANFSPAVTDHDYGWRQGRVEDPYGHHWEIGHELG